MPRGSPGGRRRWRPSISIRPTFSTPPTPISIAVEESSGRGRSGLRPVRRHGCSGLVGLHNPKGSIRTRVSRRAKVAVAASWSPSPEPSGGDPVVTSQPRGSPPRNSRNEPSGPSPGVGATPPTTTRSPPGPTPPPTTTAPATSAGGTASAQLANVSTVNPTNGSAGSTPANPSANGPAAASAPVAVGNPAAGENPVASGNPVSWRESERQRESGRQRQPGCRRRILAPSPIRWRVGILAPAATRWRVGILAPVATRWRVGILAPRQPGGGWESWRRWQPGGRRESWRRWKAGPRWESGAHGSDEYRSCEGSLPRPCGSSGQWSVGGSAQRPSTGRYRRGERGHPGVPGRHSGRSRCREAIGSDVRRGAGGRLSGWVLGRVADPLGLRLDRGTTLQRVAPMVRKSHPPPMLPLDAEHPEVAKARAGRLAQASAVRPPDIPDGMRGIESPKGGSVPTFGQSGNGEPGRC